MMHSAIKPITLVWGNLRFYSFMASFLFALPLSAKLRADSLSLKDGKEVEGFFLREYGRKIAFQDLDGKKHIIAASQIKKMRISLSGVPACYLMEDDDPDEKECNVLLVRIGEKEITFATGKGFHELDKIDIDDLAQIEIFYKNYPFRALPPIQKGLQFQAQVSTGRTQFIGKVLSASQKYIFLKGKRGRSRKYSVGNIKKILFSFTEKVSTDTLAKGLAHEKSKPEKTKTEEESLWIDYLVPGWLRYKQGQKWRGASMFVASALLLAGTALEYSNVNAAVSRAKKAGDAQEVNKQKKLFDKHEKNQRYYAYALLGVYSWHILDLIYFDNKANTAMHKQNAYKTTYMSFFPLFQKNSQGAALGFSFNTGL